jgi:sulfatase maturation enzyme AslB (radical SAM superfamily)
MRIGHIDHGIDVDQVERLFDDFRNLEWKDCENCWIVPFCPCCFLHPLSEGKFNKEKLKLMCKIWRNHYHRMIETYCSILEKNENAFDYLDDKDVSVIPEISNA